MAGMGHSCTKNNGIFRVLIFVACVILLALAVPRFLHELALVPGTDAVQRIYADGHVNEEAMVLVEKTRRNALNFHENPRARATLGSVYLIRAGATKDPTERADFLEKAIEYMELAVKDRPLDSETWMNLTTAHVLSGEAEYRNAVITWRKSIETNHFNQRLMLPRMHVGIFLSDNAQIFSEYDMALLRDQLAMTYQWHKSAAKRYAQENDLTDWFVFLSEPDSEMYNYFKQKTK